jgi:hypothetical protein
MTRWNSDHDKVKATNIFKGDLQKSLVLLVGDKGCNAALLKEKDKNGDPIDKMTLMFLPRDQSILRQYECASEPVVLLSKFLSIGCADFSPCADSPSSSNCSDARANVYHVH